MTPQPSTNSNGRYPERPQYFAQKFTRLLCNASVAAELGKGVFVLLATVAAQEDARGYRGPVTFHNGHLMGLCGFKKWEQLDVARRCAIQAGWLHYTPPPSGVKAPGSYYVTIPIEAATMRDAALDENEDPVRLAYLRGYDDGVHSRACQPYPINGYGHENRIQKMDTDKDTVRGTVTDTVTDTLRGNFLPIPIPNPIPEPKRRKRESAADAAAPTGLLLLIDAWNSLGRSIVLHNARRDPPSKAALDGWRRAERDPELKAALANPQELVAAIKAAPFCHKQPWFDLESLFTKAKDGQWKAVKLLKGSYKDDQQHWNGSRKSTPKFGPGQTYDPTYTGGGRF